MNKEFQSLHCETMVSKDGVLFSDQKVLKEVEKNESIYLKSMFKKEKGSKKHAKEAAAAAVAATAQANEEGDDPLF